MRQKQSKRRCRIKSGCVVIIVLVGLLISTCRKSEDVRLVVPAGEQAGDLTRPESCTYMTDDKEYAAECSILTVPEDPNLRLIALPVMRIPATGKDVTEPIFWLSNGPGQSNMRFSHPQDLDAFLENHDFVLTGYRGVDGQIALDCPEISAALRNPPGELLSNAALESYSTAAVMP